MGGFYRLRAERRLFGDAGERRKRGFTNGFATAGLQAVSNPENLSDPTKQFQRADQAHSSKLAASSSKPGLWF